MRMVGIMQSNEADMVFSGRKMIARATESGLDHLIDAKMMAFIRSIDGRPVNEDSFNRRAKGEPVLACPMPEGDSVDVNEQDCVPAPAS